MPSAFLGGGGGGSAICLRNGFSPSRKLPRILLGVHQCLTVPSSPPWSESRRRNSRARQAVSAVTFWRDPFPNADDSVIWTCSVMPPSLREATADPATELPCSRALSECRRRFARFRDQPLGGHATSSFWSLVTIITCRGGMLFEERTTTLFVVGATEMLDRARPVARRGADRVVTRLNDVFHRTEALRGRASVPVETTFNSL